MPSSIVDPRSFHTPAATGSFDRTGVGEARKRRRALGATVEWHDYPGLTHDGTVNASRVDSLPFIRKVMNGQPVAGNCGARVPPGNA
ncbi:hypothetical protein [Burkholderia alba]|uniref:hypothetical protein n=1 Tax=Burkholderia alba TaxID=2683677 RepID=UPI002B05D2E8|nr:hypothetical protein [Burkholderia alba]